MQGGILPQSSSVVEETASFLTSGRSQEHPDVLFWCASQERHSSKDQTPSLKERPGPMFGPVECLASRKPPIESHICKLHSGKLPAYSL